jgi:hypothetical protein
MLPWIRVGHPDDAISRNLKHIIGVRVAKENQLDYGEMHEVINELREVGDKKRFIRKFSDEVFKVFGLNIKLDFF